MTVTSPSSRVDNIRHSLVGLRMPRALEMLDATLRRIEQGQIDGVEALDELLTEELSLRETRRIKAALRMARLTTFDSMAISSGTPLRPMRASAAPLLKSRMRSSCSER